MKKETNKLLDELTNQLEDKDDFNELRVQLFKRGIEALLKSELTAHLGHQEGDKPSSSNIRNGFSEKTIKTSEGEHKIKIPRDREATFDPVIVPKHKSISQELEDCILLLYAKGMSNRVIIDLISHTYGVEYYSSQVSIITNQLLEDIRDWQQRPLQDQYAVVWIDAIHYKIRQDGKVISKACTIVLGIDMEGKQDILSMILVAGTDSAQVQPVGGADLPSRPPGRHPMNHLVMPQGNDRHLLQHPLLRPAQHCLSLLSGHHIGGTQKQVGHRLLLEMRVVGPVGAPAVGQKQAQKIFGIWIIRQP